MDGKCAGAIVYQYYVREKRIKEAGCEFIEIAYKDDFPFDKIRRDELVVIVDFSLQKSGDFQKLYGITKSIIWIDHHKTAIELHPYFANVLEGVRSVDKAGCELTWEFYYPKKTMSEAVKLLADYDMWKFEFGDNTRLFQLGIKGYPCSPDWIMWGLLLDADKKGYVSNYVQYGKTIKRYQAQLNANLIKNFSFECLFEGYLVIACNQGMTNSQLFDSVEGDYDLMMPFIFDGKRWTVSIYTKKDIDCSELAKKYGGGGHKQAAGFQCDTLPFVT
jgi:oligoribonuclease NrnB/cAMP/cGMP phosphodiesterase (DHH superfamily)